MALALLPPKEVEDAWELIKSNAPKSMRHFYDILKTFGLV